jgi:flagellar biosynthesis/type III secretory pathway protein FliH
MTLPRARILRAEGAGRFEPLLAMQPSAAQRRRIARDEIEARLEAERIVREAHERVDSLLADAEKQALAEVERVSRQAQEEAQTQLAARWIALRDAEGVALTRDVDRVVAVAVVLAERLIGAALELTPARIADLARSVLDEARGARRARIESHPVDAEALRRHLSALQLEGDTVEVRDNVTLARGELLLHTDLGTIDAKLAPRLERLAQALHDALR